MSSIAACSISSTSFSEDENVGGIARRHENHHTTTWDGLCILCRSIDFQYVGFHYSSKSSSNGYSFQREFLAILRSSSDCTFCKHIVKIVTEWISAGLTDQTEQLDISRASAHISLETDWHVLGTTRTGAQADEKAHSVRLRISLAVPSLNIGKQVWQTRNLTFFLQRCDGLSISLESSVPTIRSCFPGTTHEARPYGGRKRPLTVDMTLFKAWKQMCQQLHGARCAQIFKCTAKIRPRVIDVYRRCLAFAEEGDQWVCLSYVWGKTNTLRLTNGNAQALSVPGSLAAGLLPNIVEDALQVTKGLGEQYLWVDSLCIKQDDEKDKAEFISRMDSIYTLAAVVIVAATCIDSNSRLPGVIPGSRRQEQEPYTIQGTTLLQSLDPPLGVKIDLRTGRATAYLGDTIWGTRAWTLQERFLASRSLVFTAEQVFWECEEAFWCEDSFREVPSISPDPHRTSLCGGELNLSWNSDVPTFDQYYRVLLEECSSRAMSFDSDGLNAFSGIIRAFENSMDVQFFWGIPTAFLESALAWGHRAHKLRQRGEAQAPDGTVKNQFPSWSWAGWISDGSTKLNNQHLTTEPLGIKFYRVSGNGQDILELRQTLKFNPKVDLLAEGSSVPSRSSRRHRVLREDLPTGPSICLSSVLCFWTVFTHLEITRQACEDSSSAGNDEIGWDIGMSQSGHCIQVSWSHIPSFRQDESVEVVALAQNRGVWDNGHIANGAIGVMIISTDGGIASRKGFAWIAIRDWTALKHREWRLIILA